MTKIAIIIPAYNEAASIGKVLKDIPKYVEETIVVNNGSTDTTEAVAKQFGATVITENQKGYGNACLKGMEHLAKKTKKPDIVVFMDGDYSDFPEDLNTLLNPITMQGLDFVIGARVKELREKGSLTPQQIFGNGLATFLMHLFFRSRFTDLGPFRAIKYDKLLALEMEDKTYGWTVEMQLKALRKKYKYTEVPVRYRKRIGVSKVSGTIKGTIMAGYKIIGWILKYSIKS